MQCPHCGAEVAAGIRFCPSCRKRVVAPSAGFSQAAQAGPPTRSEPAERPAHSAPVTRPPEAASGRPLPGAGPVYAPAAPRGAADRLERPAWVSALAILSFLGAALALVGGALVVMATMAGSSGGSVSTPGAVRGIGMVMAFVYVAVGVLYGLCGIGLWTLRPWGRILQIVLSIIGLCGFPAGTLMGVLVLVYMFRPGASVLFSGRSPADLTPEEHEQVERASRGGALFIVLLVIVILISLLVIIAIAVPSFMRARVAANESAAVGDLRTIVSAEATYASFNGQLYDSLDCLAQPARCSPGSQMTQPLLPPSFAEPVRHGYEFRFFPGPKPQPGTGTFDPTRVSPSSITSFAVVATPTTAGRTGGKTFCVDDSGMICIMAPGASPSLSEAACPADNCMPIGGR